MLYWVLSHHHHFSHVLFQSSIFFPMNKKEKHEIKAENVINAWMREECVTAAYVLTSAFWTNKNSVYAFQTLILFKFLNSIDCIKLSSFRIIWEYHVVCTFHIFNDQHMILPYFSLYISKRKSTQRCFLKIFSHGK